MFRDHMNAGDTKDNFSYYALGALYSHLDNSNEDEEMHAKDIDMAWCEYDYYELENDYRNLVDSDELEECEDEDERAELIISALESATTIIRVVENNIITPSMNVNSILVMTF